MKKAVSAVVLAVLAMAVLLPVSSFGQTTSNLSGVVYSDYYYNLNHSVPAEKDRNAFQFRRIYFTFENNITDAIKVRFRLESESNGYGSTSKINPFVKHAYIEWSNLIPNHKLYLGISETNAFKNSEELWGYRSVEKTIMDLNKISSSADLGLAVKGDLTKTLHHWLTIMNGPGYGAAEGDRYKKFGYALWITPFKGLMIEGYADYEKQNPNDPQTATAMSAGKDYVGSTSYRTLKGFVGYDQPRFSIGAEYLQRTNNKSGISSPVIQNDKLARYEKADVIKTGYSLFGSWITPLAKLKAFARYDSYDPNTSSTVYTKFASGKVSGDGVDDENTLIIAGLDYIPVSNMHLMPNVMIKNYTKKAVKNDVTARLTLYAKFDSGKIIGE
ncbi:MAG TPA: hypothetical protein PLN61_14110 [bacterium]|nr:hypothetical protein [bacterium]HQI49783.1 hypothetical protein [bacterium]HQJ63184.1 hypothetical protein [bacterium]